MAHQVLLDQVKDFTFGSILASGETFDGCRKKLLVNASIVPPAVKFSVVKKMKGGLVSVKDNENLDSLEKALEIYNNL